MKWSRTDRVWFTLLSTVAAAFCFHSTISTGRWLNHGWPHQVLVAGVLFVALSLGLYYRQRWARWIGCAAFTAGAAILLWQGYLVGFSAFRILSLAALPYVLWLLWNIPLTIEEEALEDPLETAERKFEQQKQWPIALVLQGTLPLDADMLAERAHRAFGVTFDAINQTIDPVDALSLSSTEPKPTVAGARPVFVCSWPPHLLSVDVLHLNCPTDVDFEEVPMAKILQRMEQEEVVTQPVTYVEVRLLPKIGCDEPIDNGYRLSGRLAAALADTSCLGIYFSDEDEFYPMRPRVRRALACDDPLRELRSQADSFAPSDLS